MATTTVNLTGNPDIDGILAGVRWAGDIVTYGFPVDKGQYGDYARLVDHDSNKATPALQIDETNGFSPLSEVQQQAANAAFGEFAHFTLSTVFQATPATNADVRLGMSTALEPRPDGSAGDAYAGYPGDGKSNGDVWLNPTDFNNPLLGTRAHQTYFHEIGHALGLKHGHIGDVGGNATVLPADHNSLEFSTMTYSDYVGQNIADGKTFLEGHAPQSFMMSDIAALQHMYGANFDIYAGNTSYRFDPGNGQTFIDGVAQGVPMAQDGSNSNVLFRTLWDGNGFDTYDFSAYTTALDVNLAPGGWTDVDSAVV
jgi:serralysin